MADIIAFLQGKKTYIIMIVGVIVNGLWMMGQIDDKTVIAVDSVLGFLGLGSIRAGISKGAK